MRDSYTTVRHTKCGRMRGMVVGEGGRSSGVLLYYNFYKTNFVLLLFFPFFHGQYTPRGPDH